MNKAITFGLNDRIGFEKKLFGGSSDDFNRVVSQLNTFDSFEEAKAFVDDFVKPDYNNWEGAEEFETRRRVQGLSRRQGAGVAVLVRH